MKLGILGPRGTFSETAAYRFMANPELELFTGIDEVFDAVIKNKVDFGIVPVENSLEGSVGLTLELLLKKDVKIFGEIIINIRHNLVALPGSSLEDIREVISHPHALAQCKKFLNTLNVKTRNFFSTAEAAREVAEKKLKNIAAITPRLAAERYGLEILKEDIQDESTNQTRFLVISKKDHEKTGDDKTSIILGLKDKPGALHEILGDFASRGINLTKIESRPSRKALGDYIFYLDCLGHRGSRKLREVLEPLKDKTTFVKVLGSYPKG